MFGIDARALAAESLALVFTRECDQRWWLRLPYSYLLVVQRCFVVTAALKCFPLQRNFCYSCGKELQRQRNEDKQSGKHTLRINLFNQAGN